MDLQPAKKTAVVPCAVFLSWSVLMFFSLFRMGISRFRIVTLLVLLSQILIFTTSDPRQDGQSSPFTTSLSQKVRGMRNCRVFIVGEIEKPSHGASAPISTAVCVLESRKITLGLFFYRRPIQNRPLEETTLLCLANFEDQPNHRFAVVRILLYCCM